MMDPMIPWVSAFIRRSIWDLETEGQTTETEGRNQ